MYIITENNIAVFTRHILYLEWIYSEPNWMLRAILSNGHNVILLKFDSTKTHTQASSSDLCSAISKKIAFLIDLGSPIHLTNQLIEDALVELNKPKTMRYDSNRTTSTHQDGDVYFFGLDD